MNEVEIHIHPISEGEEKTFIGTREDGLKMLKTHRWKRVKNSPYQQKFVCDCGASFIQYHDVEHCDLFVETTEDDGYCTYNEHDFLVKDIIE